jgi:hypothetical protein
METILTLKDAQKFLEEQNSFPLYHFTGIEDSAAEMLGKHRGPYTPIDLDRVTNISDAAIASLTRQSGDVLDESWSLRLGITSVSDAAAKVLGKHRGSLSLNVSSLSDAAAAALGKHVGVLALHALVEASDAAVLSLAGNIGSLSLGLKSLSTVAAQGLAKHNGRWVRDPGDTTLPIRLWMDVQAFEQENTKVEKQWGVPAKGGLVSLTLEELVSLSDEAAEALSHHQGYLWLRGLKTLSDRAADALANHKGLANQKGSIKQQGLWGEAQAALQRAQKRRARKKAK